MTVSFITIASALLALIIIATCHRVYKLSRLQSEKIAGLQNQLSALCAGAVGTDKRIINFAQTLTQLKERQNTLDLGSSPSAQGYEHAIRLARKGVAVNQLIDNCNLSDEEAHLISRLHGASNDEHMAQQELH